MAGNETFVRGLLTLSLIFIALMGIYALWADELTAAFWKTALSFGILLVLSFAIQAMSRPGDQGRGDRGSGAQT
ncbi:MAG: hypothetical protein AAGJ32_10275 [Pseudomonadota bacterium]